MTESDKEYFLSYGDLTVHDLMLRDNARVLAYKNFFEQNELYVKNKIVLDVGAGTGILSLLAARSGAKQVYAVEASEISHVCESIVRDNGYEDRITVLHGRVEDIVLTCKVDLIVSEWMGFYLLHESMFDSIILAREKFLAPGGLMVPSEASLFACPITMTDYYRDKFDMWKSFCGFNFALVGNLLKQKTLMQPIIHEIGQHQCIANPELVFHMDLHFVDKGDFDSIARCLKFETTKHSVFHGLSFWFDVQFPGEGNIVLDTGPGSEVTHWKQTIVCLPEPLLVSRGDELSFSVNLSKDPENVRRYTIDLTLLDNDGDDVSDGGNSDANDNGSDIEDYTCDSNQFDNNFAADLLRQAMEHSTT